MQNSRRVAMPATEALDRSLRVKDMLKQPPQNISFGAQNVDAVEMESLSSELSKLGQSDKNMMLGQMPRKRRSDSLFRTMKSSELKALSSELGEVDVERSWKRSRRDLIGNKVSPSRSATTLPALEAAEEVSCMAKGGEQNTKSATSTFQFSRSMSL